MNEFIKTGLFLAVAIALAVFAYLTLPAGVEQELVSDQGQEFFAEFESASAAASIEVIERNDAGDIVPFSVRREGSLWVIPSHHGYPADASSQMADAATVLLGLTKGRARSDAKTQWGDFGVLDPKEDVSTDADGFGRRVTFKDDAGNVLADLIIGNKVDDSGDMRYVREPGKKRVYEAEIASEIPTDFEKWIEKDLLKAGAWEMSKIEWDNYSVDETRGALVPGDKYYVAKNDSNQWELPDLEEGKETNTTEVSNVASAISGLKIVGVRPKPEGLGARLKAAQGFERQALAQAVARRGFFLGPEDKLYSNEGDVYVTTQKGLRYTLKFGEVVYGSGKQISSGEGGGDGAQTPAAGAAGEEGGGDAPVGPTLPDGRPNRYIMITVELDPEMTEPEGVPLPQEELTKRSTARFKLEEIRRAIQAHKDQNDGALPETLAALTEGDAPLLKELGDDPWGNAYVFTKVDDGGGYKLVSFGADGAAGGENEAADVDLDMLSRENDFQKLASDKKAYESKLEEATQQVEELEKRFGPWYYLIEAASYDKLKVAKDKLIKDKSDTEDAGETPPGGIPGLPPGAVKIGGK